MPRDAARARAPDTSDIIRRAHSNAPEAAEAIREISAALDGFVLLFVSPAYDRESIAAAAAGAFPGTTVLGCTTAGEIGPRGYETGTLVGLGFDAETFAIRTRLIAPLESYSVDDGAGIAAELMAPDGMGEAEFFDKKLPHIICQ